MMITIVLLFTICWAPFHIVHMLFEYSKCNAAVTPVIVITWCVRIKGLNGSEHKSQQLGVNELNELQ